MTVCGAVLAGAIVEVCDGAGGVYLKRDSPSCLLFLYSCSIVFTRSTPLGRGTVGTVPAVPAPLAAAEPPATPPAAAPALDVPASPAVATPAAPAPCPNLAVLLPNCRLTFVSL